LYDGKEALWGIAARDLPTIRRFEMEDNIERQKVAIELMQKIIDRAMKRLYKDIEKSYGGKNKSEEDSLRCLQLGAQEVYQVMETSLGLLEVGNLVPKRKK
jgi:hypothetical protein